MIPGAIDAGSIGSVDEEKIDLVNRVTPGLSLFSFLLPTKAFISALRPSTACTLRGLTLYPPYPPNIYTHILSEKGLSPASCLALTVCIIATEHFLYCCISFFEKRKGLIYLPKSPKNGRYVDFLPFIEETLPITFVPD